MKYIILILLYIACFMGYFFINSDGGYTAYSPMAKSHIAKIILDVCL